MFTIKDINRKVAETISTMNSQSLALKKGREALVFTFFCNPCSYPHYAD